MTQNTPQTEMDVQAKEALDNATPAPESFVMTLVKPMAKKTAKAYALHYQTDQSVNSTRSIFFDMNFIQRIIDDYQGEKKFSGIRVYLARYSNYKDPEDPNTPVQPSNLVGTNTVIIAFTTKKQEGIVEKDVDTEYYNYAAPCPPSRGCEEDEGLFK